MLGTRCNGAGAGAGVGTTGAATGTGAAAGCTDGGARVTALTAGLPEPFFLPGATAAAATAARRTTIALAPLPPTAAAAAFCSRFACAAAAAVAALNDAKEMRVSGRKVSSASALAWRCETRREETV
jgi:hypothetical protein